MSVNFTEKVSQSLGYERIRDSDGNILEEMWK